MKSRRLTTAALPVFTCGHRRRRAEPYTFIVTLWRILFTLPRTFLLTWSSRRLAIMLLLLRRCTLET
jgi:hypothetical protein